MPPSGTRYTMASPAPSLPAGSPLRRSSLPDTRSRSIHTRRSAPWAVVFALFVCFVSHALAAAPDAAIPVQTLIIDHRTPFQPGQGRMLQDRAESEAPKSTETSSHSTKTTTSGSKTTSASGSVTSTFSVAVGSSTSKSSSSSSSAAASPLPSILDSISPSDFNNDAGQSSTSCPAFFNSFLANSTFQECYSLAMLFDRSKSFFEAQKSPVSITRTLDATCAPNPSKCSDYFRGLARNLTSSENCGAEFEGNQVSLVTDSYRAMLAYATVYTAGCLKDPDTGAYCYANAVTNLTNPSSTYFYFLPLNRTLPGTTVPACGFCMQQTMALYQAASADRRQAIAYTYVTAAKQVNTICGPGFVNETLAAEVIASGAAVLGALPVWVTTALSLVAAVVWLV